MNDAAKTMDMAEETKLMLQSSILIENEDLIKVMVAINANGQKRMVLEDIQALTKLDTKDLGNSVSMLEKAGYITTTMEDIPGRSPHRVCSLTDEGKKVLKVVKIE